MAVRTQARDEAQVETARPLRRRLGDRRGDLVVAIAVALLALLLAGLVLRVWRADLDVPFSYRGETQYYLMLAKTMDDHGGFLRNPSLGAPFGLDLHDYAVGTDRLHLWLLRALTVVTGDVAIAVNLFFLLTFPLVALAAFLALRRLRIGQAPAAVVSVLFALAPYHFARGEGHLFLSAYYAVPLGAYLALATLAGEPLFGRKPGEGGPRAFLTGRTLLTVAFCFVLASTGIYYAAFGLILLVASAALAALARSGWRAVAGAGVCIALVIGFLALHLAGSVLYRSDHGANLATRRPTAESELYALKFADLVLPARDSGLPLASVTDRYRSTTPIRSEEGQTLGLIAAAGFVALLLVALVTLVGRRRLEPPLLRHAAALAVVAFLIGTVGGVSVFVAQLLTAQLRGWNRISIVISFLAFVAVALALQRLAHRRALSAAALAGILLAGVTTQAAGTPVPPYELNAQYRHDREFVQAVESRLPAGASVFVLPYIAFPETGQIVDLTENDLLRGYLHSDELRWSFGAMKGRPEDWQEELAGLPTPTVVAGAVAAGFDGLYIDRYGYGDRAAALEAELAGLLGQQPLVSGSGRQSFFDLRPRRRALEEKHGVDALGALREAVLRPLEVVPVGFMPPLRSGRFLYAWAEAAQSELRILNPSGAPRTAVFEATADRVGGPQAELVVSFPGADPATVQMPAPIRRELTLPPGESVVRFSTGAPAVEANNANELRRHFFRLAGLAVTDKGFEPFIP